MRCGKSSKYLKVQGKCAGPKATSGRTRYGKKNGQSGRSLDLLQKLVGPCETENGPKLVNCCKSEQVSTKEYGKMLKRIYILEDGRVLTNEARIWKIE